MFRNKKEEKEIKIDKTEKGQSSVPDDQKKRKNCFMRMISSIFQMLQLILMLVGVLLLAVGIYLFIKDLAHIPKAMGVGLIVVGSGLILFGIMGCIISKTGNKFASIIYIIIIILLVGMQIAFFMKIRNDSDDAKQVISRMWDNMDSQQRLGWQGTGKCCGFYEIDDRAVTPCAAGVSRGCYMPIKNALWAIKKYMVVIMSVLFSCEALLLLLTVLLCVFQ